MLSRSLLRSSASFCCRSFNATQATNFSRSFQRPSSPARSLFITRQFCVPAIKSPGIDVSKDEQIGVLEKFIPHNKFQQIAKDLNLIAMDNAFHKQTKKLRSIAYSDPTKLTTRQDTNSPVAQYQLQIPIMYRELIGHKEYYVIGQVDIKPHPEKGGSEIDYNLERFEFENVDGMGMMIFAFSSNESFYNFQNQIKGSVLKFSKITGTTLVTILAAIADKHDPDNFLDRKPTVTDGVVIDPSLPSYLIISNQKFTEFPELLSQIYMENKLRKIQYEQNKNDVAESSLDFLLNQFLDYEKFYGLLMHDSEQGECLFTLAQDVDGKDEVVAPIFFNGDEALSFLSHIENTCEDELSGRKIEVFAISGHDIVNWLQENEEVAGILFNPKDTAMETTLGSDDAPVPTEYDDSITSGYYDLPDAKHLPYLCLLYRSLFFE